MKILPILETPTNSREWARMGLQLGMTLSPWRGGVSPKVPCSHNCTPGPSHWGKHSLFWLGHWFPLFYPLGSCGSSQGPNKGSGYLVWWGKDSEGSEWDGNCGTRAVHLPSIFLPHLFTAGHAGKRKLRFLCLFVCVFFF